ncbi:unnamed protein product [Arctogadus glacialis]
MDDVFDEGNTDYGNILLLRHPIAKKKAKPLNLKISSGVGSCENLPSQRSPLHSDRSLRSFFFPSFIPSTPPVHAAETPSGSEYPTACLRLNPADTPLTHTHT